MLNRERITDILEAHGLKPDSDTAVDWYGEYVKDTSFDDEVGIKERYTISEVYDWLGY